MLIRFRTLSAVAIMIAVTFATAAVAERRDRRYPAHQRDYARSAQFHGSRSHASRVSRSNGGVIIGGVLLPGVVMTAPPVAYAPPPARYFYPYAPPPYYQYPYTPTAPIYYGR